MSGAYKPTTLWDLMSFTRIYVPYQLIPFLQWPKKRTFTVKINKGTSCASRLARGTEFLPGHQTARLRQRRPLPLLG